ncbi:unnamed protein product [Camellia sinensis]
MASSLGRWVKGMANKPLSSLKSKNTSLWSTTKHKTDKLRDLEARHATETSGNSKRTRAWMIIECSDDDVQVLRTVKNGVSTHIPVNPVETIDRATNALTEYVQFLRSVLPEQTGSSLPQTRPNRWQPPPPGFLKANYDAAFCKQSTSASLAVVFRDSTGKIIDGHTIHTHTTSAFQAEAQAIRLACIMAKLQNWRNVVVENDNLLAIKLCVSENVPPWDSLAVFSDIRCISQVWPLFFCWTRRTSNQVAHASALSQLPVNWVAIPPQELSCLAHLDVYPPTS